MKPEASSIFISRCSIRHLLASGAFCVCATAGAAALAQDVQERDYSSDAQEPAQPNAAAEVNTPSQVEVAKDAGVGSPLAYARRSVVELGGNLALTHDGDITTFRISPSIGYFVVDNVELTLFPNFSIVHFDEDTTVQIGAVLEPSYHLPLSEALYAFAGLGFGFNYAEDPGFEALLRPRVGTDVMVGRSGIFKPALFMDVGFDEGVYAGGLEAGFTVMW